MLRGVVLDLDGTLADTAVIHSEAWKMAMRDLGIQAHINIEQLLGRRAPEIALELAKGNTDLAQRLLERKNGYFRNLVGLAKPKACAIELLKSLKGMGVKLSVVTSSNKVSAYSVLETVNMINLVDYIITGDDVSKGKPDPEPVIKALKLMNNESSEVMGVGDTIHDYEAYLKAGLKAIVIVVNPLMIDYITKFKEALIVNNLCVLLNVLNVVMGLNT